MEINIRFFIMSGPVIVMKNVSDKSSGENQNTHFMVSFYFSPSKIVPFMR